MKVLLTGGAGYIGSHTYLCLLDAGYTPVILDDFSNAKPEVIRRLEKISGQTVPLIHGSLLNAALLNKAFADHQFDAVIHFAAFKSLNESLREPLKYYDNNVTGMVRLLAAMTQHQCHKLVFSSSAVVYGHSEQQPVTEQSPLQHSNPYGHTKIICEEMLQHLANTDKAWSIGVLRYFNPVGAHESGLIGEDPNGTPANLVPFVAQAASGVQPHVNVYGNNYDTPDGTGVRDYIHIQDLAEAHVSALAHLLNATSSFTVNVGTGVGYSVMDVIHAYSQACGHAVPYVVSPRREPDVAVCYANTEKAAQVLGWKAKRTLQDMCESSWKWQSLNPNGYPS